MSSTIQTVKNSHRAIFGRAAWLMQHGGSNVIAILETVLMQHIVSALLPDVPRERTFKFAVRCKAHSTRKHQHKSNSGQSTTRLAVMRRNQLSHRPNDIDIEWLFLEHPSPFSGTYRLTETHTRVEGTLQRTCKHKVTSSLSSEPQPTSMQFVLVYTIHELLSKLYASFGYVEAYKLLHFT